eukprot:Hpha_TRINITY_DN30447_c0_g1::TRINITY_DN30447_c0_g1_i1::g.167953::m.167953
MQGNSGQCSGMQGGAQLTREVGHNTKAGGGGQRLRMRGDCFDIGEKERGRGRPLKLWEASRRGGVVAGMYTASHDLTPIMRGGGSEPKVVGGGSKTGRSS